MWGPSWAAGSLEQQGCRSSRVVPKATVRDGFDNHRAERRGETKSCSFSFFLFM